MRKAGMKVEGEELDESWALYQAVISDENIEVEAWSPGKSAPRFGSSGKTELPSETAEDVSGYKDRQTNNENLSSAIEYENPVTNEGLDHIMDQEGAEIEANDSGEGYLFYENEGGNSTTKGIIILDSRENMPNSLGNALKEVDYEN